MKFSKKIILALLALFIMMMLSACGTKAMVTINDGGVKTEIEVTLPRTVDKILQAAEITLNEGDIVTPSGDTKLSEPEEIVVGRKRTVQLDVMGETKSVTIVGGTVGDLLKQEGITLTDKQNVSPAQDQYITDGMQVKVFTLNSIIVTCDGKTETKNVGAAKVGDALAEAGIKLGADDRVSFDLEHEVSDGMEITVDRVKYETITEAETIEYEVIYEYDDSMNSGVEETRVSGENGERQVTYKVTYVNGEEESRDVEEEKIIKEPVNAVVTVGTYEEPSSSSSSSGGRSVVSKKAYYDCDGSGHGYYEIVYSDGSTEYEQF